MFKDRFKLLTVFLLLSFFLIYIRLFYISIFKHNQYKEVLDNTIYAVIEGRSAPRGRIYDRNHKLLVDNVGVKTIYYKRTSKISTKDEIDIAYKLSNILELDYNRVTNSMLKDLWLRENDGNNKITNKEWEKLKTRKITNMEIELLKRERITKEELEFVDKKAAYIYYLMNNGYSYEEKIIQKNVSDKIYAIIEDMNLKGVICKLSWDRKYLYGDSLRGILGNVSSESVGVTEDLKSHYLSKGYKINDRVGLSGLEYQYDEYLRGKKAKYKNMGNGLELIEKEKRGNDIVLSIDIDLQLELEKVVEEEILKAKKEPNTTYFNKAFAIVSDPNTGEILSMVSKVYDKGNIYDYSSYITTSSVTVGSVIKGASISVGYKEKVIDIGSILKDECVKILNTPVKCSWNRNGLGYLNDINALRLSSNVYQFKTAMKVSGKEYYYDMPFSLNTNAFDKYRSMFNSYGLGVKTGIDLPNESTGIKGNNDTPGLLLDFSIGQYDTYTPLQLTQYINTIASEGTRYKLHLLKSVHKNTGNELSDDILLDNESYILNRVELDNKYLKRIKEGFKAVLGYNGTGYGYIDLKYNPAGKTGTSQSFYDSDFDGVIDKATITSTFAGFAPFDDPKMSVVVVTPDISLQYGSSYLSQVNKRISNEISKKYFEIYE